MDRNDVVGEGLCALPQMSGQATIADRHRGLSLRIGNCRFRMVVFPPSNPFADWIPPQGGNDWMVGAWDDGYPFNQVTGTK